MSSHRGVLVPHVEVTACASLSHAVPVRQFAGRGLVEQAEREARVGREVRHVSSRVPGPKSAMGLKRFSVGCDYTCEP